MMKKAKPEIKQQTFEEKFKFSPYDKDIIDFWIPSSSFIFPAILYNEELEYQRMSNWQKL